MKLCLFFFFFTMLAACGNEASPPAAVNDSAAAVHTGATDTIVTSAEPFILNGCYQMIMKRDTALLQINLQDSTVTGNLEFRLNGQEKNPGTIEGVLRDSLIIADFTFQSQNTISVREVIFKLKAGSLLQGYGELTKKENKVVYKDPGQLLFHSDFPFLKVDCNEEE